MSPTRLGLGVLSLRQLQQIPAKATPWACSGALCTVYGARLSHLQGWGIGLLQGRTCWYGERTWIRLQIIYFQRQISLIREYFHANDSWLWCTRGWRSRKPTVLVTESHQTSVLYVQSVFFQTVNLGKRFGTLGVIFLLFTEDGACLAR